MVTTRHSLSALHDNRATSEASLSTAAGGEDMRTLADVDSREAARLATNANFDDDVEEKNGGGEDLGTYHWRGAVYAIEKTTPKEWIEQGEAEWANTLRKRERVKKEREEEIADRKRKRVAEVDVEKNGKMEAEMEKKTEVGRKKRKSNEVGDVEMKVEGRRKSMPSKSMGKMKVVEKRRKTTSTLPSRSTRPKIPSRPSRTTRPLRSSSNGTSKRKQEKTSSSSTASSNIEVAHTRRPFTATKKKSTSQFKKTSRPPPTDPRHDISSGSPSEDDSAGDLPTSPRRFNVRAERDNKKHITSSRSASKKKGYHTSPLPAPPTRDAVMQSLTVGLYALGKTNDRVEQLKKWWDGVRKEGAFQRLIEIVKKIQEGKESEREEKESLRDFADSVAGDANVQLLLRDMAVEEEQLEEEKKKRRSSTREDDNNNEDRNDDDEMIAEYEEGIITPQSEDAVLIPNTQPISIVQPTPPASIDEAHQHHHQEDEEEDEITHPTPPLSISAMAAKFLKESLLPAHDRGGNPLRWSFDPAKLNNLKSQLKTRELVDEGRAEFEISKGRLEGESRTQRRRRVRRELREVVTSTTAVTTTTTTTTITDGGDGGGGGNAREVDGWTIIRVPVAEDDGEDEYGDVEMQEDDDVVYEHREPNETFQEEEIVGEKQEMTMNGQQKGGADESEDGDFVHWVARGGAAAEQVLANGGRVGRGKTKRRMRSTGMGKGRAGR